MNWCQPATYALTMHGSKCVEFLDRILTEIEIGMKDCPEQIFNTDESRIVTDPKSRHASRQRKWESEQEHRMEVLGMSNCQLWRTSLKLHLAFINHLPRPQPLCGVDEEQSHLLLLHQNQWLDAGRRVLWLVLSAVLSTLSICPPNLGSLSTMVTHLISYFDKKCEGK